MSDVLEPASFLPPVKRTGLHKVLCPDCELSAYVTYAQLERRQLPRCGCGLELLPARLEVLLAVDAFELEDYERVPAYHGYVRELSRVSQGQAFAAGAGRSIRRAGIRLRPVEEVALERILKGQREELERRRASGLVQNQRAAADADAIPF